MTLTPAGFKNLMAHEYTDQEGLISPDKNPGRWTSGNGALDTSIYYIILMLTGQLTESDSFRFEAIISNLWADGKQGLLSRNRGRPDQDAWDNYWGVCAAGLMCDAVAIPRAIRTYGESHCWMFQNEPGLKAFLSAQMWRFPGFSAMVELCCADERPPGGLGLAGLGYRLRRFEGTNPGSARTDWLAALAVLYSYPPNIREDLRQAALFHLRCINNAWGSVRGMLAAYHGSSYPFAQIHIPTPYWITRDKLHPVDPEAPHAPL